MRSGGSLISLPSTFKVRAWGKTLLRICTPELSKASHRYSSSSSKLPNVCVVHRKLLPEPETDSPVSTPSATVYLALPLCSSQPSRFVPLNRLTQPFCASSGDSGETARAEASKKNFDAFIWL